MSTHKDLDVYTKGVDLAETVYRLTMGFPKVEMFGLVSQMRRAAVSIPSNIAEGSARHSKKEFIRFLRIAQGSLQELDTQYILAQRLGFLPKGCLDQDIESEGKLISGLIRFLGRGL